jgi:hypothetical protein
MNSNEGVLELHVILPYELIMREYYFQYSLLPILEGYPGGIS